MSRWRSRSGHSLLLAAGLICIMGSACAKRLRFSPSEFDRVKQQDRGVGALRVYTSKKLVTVYDQVVRGDGYQVNRSIRESSARNQLREVITRQTPGQVLAIDERNGSALLWVTFDPACDHPKCAYGFVQTEDGGFKLADVPLREGYHPPKPYHCRTKEKFLLKPNKRSSLAEANDVLLAKLPSGKILGIDLDVKKIVNKNVATRTRRSRGID